MSLLKAMLIEGLNAIDGFEDVPSPVAGGTAIFYRGKEVAHFHIATEIDARLTKAIIKSEGLSHPPDSDFHPNRKPSSQWIELRFRSRKQVAEVVRLFKLAFTE